MLITFDKMLITLLITLRSSHNLLIGTRAPSASTYLVMADFQSLSYPPFTIATYRICPKFRRRIC